MPAAQTTSDVPTRAVVLLASAAFSSSLNVRACDPILPEIARAFDASVGSASRVVAMFAIAYGLTQLCFGPAGDRYGKYLVVAGTALAAGIATALCAFMPTLGSLSAARFVAGGFAAAAIPLAFAWLGDAIPFERRQPVLARFLSAQFMGIVLAQALGGLIADLYGWRTVFLVVGAAHLIAGVLMLYELKTNPAAQPPGATASGGIGGALRGMLAIAQRPWAMVLLGTVFVEAFAMYGAFAYVGADLAHRFGLRPGVAGAVLAVYGAGAILYSLFGPRMIRTLGERGLALSGGLLLASAFTGLALTRTVWSVPLLMASMGLGFYMLHNVLQNHATQMAPEARGLGVSMFALALFAGQSAGVAAAAPLIDRWGAPPAYLLAASALVLLTFWFRERLLARSAVQ